jgi:excisionase family DNA binding protein
MDNKLMNVDEASQYVGLSQFTVRRLARNGVLPAAKIGRAYRFKREDIDSYIRTQYKGASDANGSS